MILANVRCRLVAADLQLVVRALARDDPGRRDHYERVLATVGPDQLLDEPGLWDALLAVRSLEAPSLPLFAYVAMRRALVVAQIDNRDLADYLAALLLEFGKRGRAARIRKIDDRSYAYLVDILAALAEQGGGGERGFLLQAHLGNYSLWLAGLFPDYIAARRTRSGGPDLPYYDEVGRHGYRLASRHGLAKRLGLAPVLRTAAECFPALRVALNRLSDRLFFPDITTPDRLLRSL
jgi:hypothetical protein